MRRILVLFVALAVFGAASPAYSGPLEDMAASITALQKGEWAEAVSLITRALDSGQLPADALVPAYGNRGMAYYKLGQNEQAITDLTRSIELIPGSGYDMKYAAWSYTNRAGVHIAMDNYAAGLKDADQALRLSPNDASSHYNRALCYEGLGRRDAAIQDFRRTLALKPTHSGARKGLERLGAL